MNVRHFASLTALLLASAALAQDRKDDTDRYVYKYVVMGKTKADPVERKLSLEYDTQGEAQKELEAKQRAYHDRNGLLYGTPEEDKPIALRVATFRYPRGSPSQSKEVPSEPPTQGKTKPIEVGKPVAPVDVPKNVSKLEGTLWSNSNAGGEFNEEVTLGAKGLMIFVNRAGGRTQGKWSVTGDRFEGVVEGRAPDHTWSRVYKGTVKDGELTEVTITYTYKGFGTESSNSWVSNFKRK